MAAADVAYVQSICSVADAAVTRDYQAALKIAAQERYEPLHHEQTLDYLFNDHHYLRRSNLDHAFATRLQAVHNAGTSNIDTAPMKDADHVLGMDAVESILVRWAFLSLRPCFQVRFQLICFRYRRRKT